MIENLSKEVSFILEYLLPGFISAWIFHSFTSHPKLSQFESMIEALIFTILIRPFVYFTEIILVSIGNCIDKYITLGVWNSEISLTYSIIYAIAIGFVFSFFSNNDKFHDFIRKLKISRETSYPSEWFAAFNQDVSDVVLQLNDGRRIIGWPREWPSDPKIGHFKLQEAAWLDGQKEIPLAEIKFVLINVNDIQWVEILQERGIENEPQRTKSTTS